ncbi:MAG TPA: hypothetical protein VFT44_13960 [Pyrinomonadaceae bacterium]|nr:hypothetical protein [Pyrinomonadaceae bacterium]
MIISVINHTNGKVSDEELQDAIRAVNRQIAHDFEPYWSVGAALRLEGRSTETPDKMQLQDMRGDSVLYLWDRVDVDDALGYHDANHRGIPFGFVFTELSEKLGEKWTVTLSHEALELIADPEVNLLVAGPHPADPKKTVFHWYEMCDAVQADSYKVDGVEVSNFLLPLYFTGEDEFEGRNDFLGRRDKKKKALRSFGINPGGYIGFFNPQSGEHETFALSGDAVAKKRLEVKGKAIATRRSVRYRSLVEEVAEDSPTERYAPTRRMHKRAAASHLALDCERIDTGPKLGRKALAERRRL